MGWFIQDSKGQFGQDLADLKAEQSAHALPTVTIRAAIKQRSPGIPKGRIQGAQQKGFDFSSLYHKHIPLWHFEKCQLCLHVLFSPTWRNSFSLSKPLQGIDGLFWMFLDLLLSTMGYNSSGCYRNTKKYKCAFYAHFPEGILFYWLYWQM